MCFHFKITSVAVVVFARRETESWQKGECKQHAPNWTFTSGEEAKRKGCDKQITGKNKEAYRKLIGEIHWLMFNNLKMCILVWLSLIRRFSFTIGIRACWDVAGTNIRAIEQFLQSICTASTGAFYKWNHIKRPLKSRQKRVIA